MGTVWSWVSSGGDDTEETPQRTAATVAVLRSCRSLRNVPVGALGVVAEYACFQGVLVGAVPLLKEVGLMVALPGVLVAADADEVLALSPSPLTITHRLRIAATSLARLASILWVGGHDGSLRLCSSSLKCLRIAIAHDSPIAALVVSSQEDVVFSYPLASGENIRVWSVDGVLVETVAKNPVVKGLNMVMYCGDGGVRLWDDEGVVWEGAEQGVQSAGEGRCSSFEVSDGGASEVLAEGTLCVASRAHRISDTCTASLRGSHVFISDAAGHPRTPPWRFPSRSSTSATAVCVHNGNLFVATSDCVLYEYS